MRTSLYALVGAGLLALAYIASPFIAVWQIREAIQNSNADYLENKIEWTTVRSTLRASLTRIALNTPETASAPNPPPNPGLWQRIKNGFSQRAVDSMIESYVTPEGLPQLFTYRKFYRENVSGAAAADAALPWYTRAANFWARVKRAEFKDAATFEIEMADRNDPTRHYIGLLALRGLEWKLTELHLRIVADADAAPSRGPNPRAVSAPRGDA